MLSNTFSDSILDMGVSDHRNYIENIENKIENVRLQECSLKNISFFNVNSFLMQTF